MNNEILKVRIKNLIKKSQRHNAEIIFLIWSLKNCPHTNLGQSSTLHGQNCNTDSCGNDGFESTKIYHNFTLKNYFRDQIEKINSALCLGFKKL